MLDEGSRLKWLAGLVACLPPPLCFSLFSQVMSSLGLSNTVATHTLTQHIHFSLSAAVPNHLPTSTRGRTKILSSRGAAGRGERKRMRCACMYVCVSVCTFRHTALAGLFVSFFQFSSRRPSCFRLISRFHDRVCAGEPCCCCCWWWSFACIETVLFADSIMGLPARTKRTLSNPRHSFDLDFLGGERMRESLVTHSKKYSTPPARPERFLVLEHHLISFWVACPGQEEQETERKRIVQRWLSCLAGRGWALFYLFYLVLSIFCSCHSLTKTTQNKPTRHDRPQATTVL